MSKSRKRDRRKKSAATINPKGDLEIQLGEERRLAVEKRARYETTRNALSGRPRRVFVTTIVRAALDDYLSKNPPEPNDAITAAMRQVSA